MPNKCDVLRVARNQVADKGRITCRYFDGECYCAIGYILKGLGLTDSELAELGTTYIGSIYHRAAYRPHTSIVCTKVYQGITEAGITVDWLRKLQRVNDNECNSDEMVVGAFDDILAEANC